MTRWDCDVKIRRGVPCSFPSFHGWRPERSPHTVFTAFDDVVASSTAATRYIWCRACHQWVPEPSQFHACMAATPPTASAADSHFESGFASADDKAPPKPSVYVISTEENSESYACHVCTDRMRLEFLPDIDEWIFMDCVAHEGVVIHELCRDCVYA